MWNNEMLSLGLNDIERDVADTGGVDRSIEKMDSSLLLLVSKQRTLRPPSQILRYVLRWIHLLLAPTQCEKSGFHSQLSKAFLRRQGGDASTAIIQVHSRNLHSIVVSRPFLLIPCLGRLLFLASLLDSIEFAPSAFSSLRASISLPFLAIACLAHPVLALCYFRIVASCEVDLETG